MSEALSIDDLSFLADDEVEWFNLEATTNSDVYGYILEVDLKYPELHDTPIIPSPQKD